MPESSNQPPPEHKPSDSEWLNDSDNDPHLLEKDLQQNAQSKQPQPPTPDQAPTLEEFTKLMENQAWDTEESTDNPASLDKEETTNDVPDENDFAGFMDSVYSPEGNTLAPPTHNKKKKKR